MTQKHHILEEWRLSVYLNACAGCKDLNTVTDLLTETEGKLKQAICNPPGINVQGWKCFPVLTGCYAFIHRH